MVRSRVGAALVAGALFLLSVGIPTAAAGGRPTRYVDVDGQASAAGCDALTAAYSTIQSAVTAAADGDRILVCPGTYQEQIVVPPSKRDLLIQSWTEYGARILSPAELDQDSLIRIRGDQIVLQHFKLVALATETGCEKLYAMVEVTPGASAVIRSNRMYTAGGDSLGSCGYVFGVFTFSEADVTAGGPPPNGTGAKSSVLWNVIKDFQIAGVVTLGSQARSRVNRNSIQYLHGNPSPFDPGGEPGVEAMKAAGRRYEPRIQELLPSEGYQRARARVRAFSDGEAIAGGKGPFGGVGIAFVVGGYGTANGNVIYSGVPAGTAGLGDEFLLAGIVVGNVTIAVADDPVGPPGVVSLEGNLIAFTFIAIAADDEFDIDFRENFTIYAFAHVVLDGALDGLVARHVGIIGVDGMVVTDDSAENRIVNSSFLANEEYDCYDDTTGTGTGGTANFWNNVDGETANRPDICEPGVPPAP